MSINGISPSMIPISGGQSGGGQNPQIKALEQKLMQLNSEKKKAAQNHDEEKVKELEKQLQEVEQKIEKLKQKEQKKQQQQKESGLDEESKENPPYLQDPTGWYA